MRQSQSRCKAGHWMLMGLLGIPGCRRSCDPRSTRWRKPRARNERRKPCPLLVPTPSLALDVLQQRVDRRAATGGVGACPTIGPETLADLAVESFAEFSHRTVATRATNALAHRVAGTKNPRRPCVISFEDRRAGKRSQRINEPEPVAELPA